MLIERNTFLQRKYLKKKTSNVSRIIFFLLGVAGFFVKNEPSPFEFIGLIALFLNARYFKKSDVFSIILLTILLNISSFFSYNIERSLQYNFVTIFLICFGFLFYRLNYLIIREFIYGCIFGMLLTLIISLTNPDLIDAWYYTRLMGGFKDPNVLAPTTLFVLIILNELDLSINRIVVFCINLSGLILIILAQSRAALLLTFLYIFYKIFSKNIKTRVFIILSILISGLFFSTSFENFYQSKFGSRTDDRRFSGQKEALHISTLLGNGATSSDYLVGHPPHNSVVRIISDNGFFTFCVLFVWFVIILLNTPFQLDKYYLIFLGVLIGFVIDTLHWRIIFIYISCVLFINNNKVNGKLYI